MSSDKAFRSSTKGPGFIVNSIKWSISPWSLEYGGDQFSGTWYWRIAFFMIFALDQSLFVYEHLYVFDLSWYRTPLDLWLREYITTKKFLLHKKKKVHLVVLCYIHFVLRVIFTLNTTFDQRYLEGDIEYWSSCCPNPGTLRLLWPCKSPTVVINGTMLGSRHLVPYKFVIHLALLSLMSSFP